MISARRATIGAASTGGLLAATAYAARGRSSQFFGPSVYRGFSKRRSIALTFDDGPSPDSCRLIEYLSNENIKATFFECGMNVARHPAIAREIYAAGHEIGNHTYSHPRLAPGLGANLRWHSPAFILREFSDTQSIIHHEVGLRPTLLRAPYGYRWFGLRETQRQLGLLGVMWTVIGRDWILPSQGIIDLVLRRASPGGIICLHDGRDVQVNPDVSEMIKALKGIVPVLRDRGYQFETVSQIVRSEPAVR